MQGNLKRAPVPTVLFRLVCAAGLLIGLSSTPGLAQEAKGKGYLPHLADLMNEAMQVHHAKLWFAGHANNWELASYELKKIKETIEEVKETIVEIQTAAPQWQRVPVGEMLAILDGALVNLDQAVKTKDAAKFDTAYHELTATCNAVKLELVNPRSKLLSQVRMAAAHFRTRTYIRRPSAVVDVHLRHSLRIQ